MGETKRNGIVHVWIVVSLYTLRSEEERGGLNKEMQNGGEETEMQRGTETEMQRGGGNEIQRGEGGGREGGYAMQRRGGGKGIVGCDLDNKLQEGGWLELVDEC